jgi:hypothetical protein
MTHTDTDIAEILQRFSKQVGKLVTIEHFTIDYSPDSEKAETHVVYNTTALNDFITRECLALKKKWEREHFDNQ